MVKKTVKQLMTGVALSTLAFSADAALVKKDMAKMQAMDKITGMVRVVNVPVNSEVKFGSFSIVVRTCKATPPEEAPENYAFVDVIDNFDKEDEKVNIFKGWMMSSSPALNSIAHPIYDVWLLQCTDEKINGIRYLTDDELKARDAVRMSEKAIDSQKLGSNDQEPGKESAQKDEQPVVAPVETPAPTPAVAQEVKEDVVGHNAEVQYVDPLASEEQQVEQGPKSLINIQEVEQPVQQQENVVAEPAPAPELEVQGAPDEAVTVRNGVVVNDEHDAASMSQEAANAIETRQEIAPVINSYGMDTDIPEENGMLEDQLIDFSATEEENW